MKGIWTRVRGPWSGLWTWNKERPGDHDCFGPVWPPGDTEKRLDLKGVEHLMDWVWEVRGRRNEGWPWGLYKAAVWWSWHLLRQGRQRGNRLALCVVYQSWVDKSKEMSNLNCIFLPDTKGENWARAKAESTFSLFSIVETQGILWSCPSRDWGMRKELWGRVDLNHNRNTEHMKDGRRVEEFVWS